MLDVKLKLARRSLGPRPLFTNLALRNSRRAVSVSKASLNARRSARDEFEEPPSISPRTAVRAWAMRLSNFQGQALGLQLGKCRHRG